MRRRALLAAGLLLGGAGSPQPPWPEPPAKGRLRRAPEVNGWTFWRDREADPASPDYGLLMLRRQRPVPADQRAAWLPAFFQDFRPFRVPSPPAAAALSQNGWPARRLETRAFSRDTGAPFTLRALAVFGPAVTLLAIAAAPETLWPVLEPEFAAALAQLGPVNTLRH